MQPGFLDGRTIYEYLICDDVGPLHRLDWPHCAAQPINKCYIIQETRSYDAIKVNWNTMKGQLQMQQA